MQSLNYNGSLKKDIKSVLIRNKKSDIIIKSSLIGLLINAGVILSSLLLSMVDISNNETILLSIATVTSLLDIELFIGNPFRKIKRRKSEAIESESRINDLTKSLVGDMEEETNFMPSITTKDALIESIQVENKSNDGKLETDFYSLDNNDKILVLREIKKYIDKHVHSLDEEYDLYLLDEEDLPDELPVVRRLEVTNNERN